jgi:hypothetical protein
MTMVLHGCGGGDSTTSSPSPAGPTTVATTTSTPLDIPATPWDVADAVRVLNYMYMNFDEGIDSSHLGVTMSMAAMVGTQRDGSVATFSDNLFCSPLMDTSCFQGQADCRMSASLLNHKVMIDGNKVSQAMTRPVGYIFNQDLTESHWGKCAYIWDGADSSALNNGCGAGAKGSGCGDRQSAFANQCNQDDWNNMHNCTRADPEIENRLCKCDAASPTCSASYGHVDPPDIPSASTCFYEMPALGYQPYDTTITEVNHLRDSVKQRVVLQGTDESMTSQWNEVVIDNRLLIPKIREDPANAIWAFVCVSGVDGACDLAKAMRDEFVTAYKVSGGVVPVVEMNVETDFTANGGPFQAAPSSQIIA